MSAIVICEFMDEAAIREGLAEPAGDVAGMIEATVWEPEYRVFA